MRRAIQNERFSGLRIPVRGLTALLAIHLGCVWALVGGTGGGENRISITCQFELPRLESSGQYTRLTVPGCDPLHRLGAPVMPFRTARLLLPAGYTVEKAEAIPLAQPVRLPGTWRVEYAGQPYCRPGAGKFALPTRINHLIYDSDAPYPQPAAELLSLQRLAGYDIALVRVFPLQYKPASGQLAFTEQLRLQLTLRPASTNAPPPIRPPSLRQAQARIAAFVDNPDLLAPGAPAGKEARPEGSARTRPESMEEPPAAGTATSAPALGYLLITSAALSPAFQPLVQCKLQEGLAVQVATVEAITNTFPGRDVPEKIRNCIRHAYTNSGISFVLLGGGTTVVPCRYAYVRTWLAPKDSYLPCDLYYACLDGSWNATDDRHWGEPVDGENGRDVDLLAEVYVGRAPVTTLAQADTFVAKSLRYESEGNARPASALLMATFLGEFLTGPCQGGEMFNPLLPLLEGWQLSHLDDRPHKLPQWSRTEVLAALNQSPHLVLYNGHGTADISMRMRTTDLTRLTNQWPFLACSVGCSAGEFDHGKFWPDSFGETLVNGSRHGAVAAIVNARAGWFDPQYPWKYSGELQARFFNELLTRGHPRLGVAHQHSKEDLIGQVETTGSMYYRWCYYEFTLLGDPHLAWKLPAETSHPKPQVQNPMPIERPKLNASALLNLSP